MIPPTEFVRALQAHGVSFASGVPCSYLRGVQVELWRAPALDAVNASNEGDALAVCAGASLAGRRPLVFVQNSGLGNAVNPLASLTHTFRIPVLLLVGRRGDPAESDEPQHRLMGSISGDLLELLEIPWEPVPADMERLEATLARGVRHVQAQRRPFALLAGSRTFANGDPQDRPQDHREWKPDAGRSEGRPAVLRVGSDRDGPPPSRAEALAWIQARTPLDRCVVVASTGYTSRELYALADRPNQFYMVGSMGCAAALGLGLARARPDLSIVVVEGDGSALMRLSSLPLLGSGGTSNLTHVVLDNGAHESTGGQPTLSAGIELAEIARASGYGLTACGASLDALERAWTGACTWGPRFVHLRIRPGTRAGLPRPDRSPEQVRARFERHLADRSLDRPPARERAREEVS